MKSANTSPSLLKSKFGPLGLSLLSALMLGGCATLVQPLPPQGAAPIHTVQLAKPELGDWQADAPLFPQGATVWEAIERYAQTPWDEVTLPEGAPIIVGRLPGQRQLPLEHFEEAAVLHNPVDEGTLYYYDNTPPDDLWQRVREGFDLPHIKHPRITTQLNWYKRHQSYMDRVSGRAERYLYLILEEVEKRGIPSEIALLPIVESAFQPFAYSHGRAAGIWQIIPSTGRLYGLKQNWWYDGRRDVLASTKAALTLLENLSRSFKGDWLLALAAYNSGQGTVQRAIRKNKRRGKPTDFWSLDLPRETRAYVPKLIAIASLIEHPEKFGIKLQPIDNIPQMVKISTSKQIDLALAAELAGITLEELYLYNPGFNRWATDPDGPHYLMLPTDKAEVFEDNLAQLPDEQRVAWERHRIRKGDSLLTLADRYNTTVALIKDVNNIRGNMIREGQNLVIPVSTRKLTSYTLSAEQRLKRLQNTRRRGREKVTYRVRRGDTLWDISRKYKVGVRTLAKWNGLAPRDTLRAGQKLVIWSKGGSLIKASSSRFTPHERTQKIRYRVRRGDSLARISRKFNVNLHDLIRWNGISPKKYLQPGQKLTLYVDVTQQGNI